MSRRADRRVAIPPLPRPSDHGVTGLQKAGWLQQQKLSEMERGLVDTIGQRRAAEVALAAERAAAAAIAATHAEQTAAQDASRAVAAALLEQVSTLAGLRKATLRRETKDAGFGLQIADVRQPRIQKNPKKTNISFNRFSRISRPP